MWNASRSFYDHKSTINRAFIKKDIGLIAVFALFENFTRCGLDDLFCFTFDSNTIRLIAGGLFLRRKK